MSQRYIVERDVSDWCIVEYIKGKRFVKATGLDLEEAEQTAKQWSEQDQQEKSDYV
jgi:hypothetical protein